MESNSIFLKKKWKESVTKSNARYRGVTELNQYSNFVLESAHDMNKLAHIFTGNEATNQNGHQKDIEDNFISLMNGERNPASFTAFTASKMIKVSKEDISTPSLLNWEKLGGCKVTKVGESVKLYSPNTHSISGIRTPLYVTAGEVIMIRMKVKSTINMPEVKFGSNSISGEEQMKSIQVDSSKNGFYVDYRLYCSSHETIFLNIHLHEQPLTEVTSGEIEIEEFQIKYVNEKDVELKGLNSEIKRDLNELREKINFIKI